MFKEEDLKEIAAKRAEWEEKTLRPSLARLKLTESPNKVYTPCDNSSFDYLAQVGFPGEYPFTAGNYPSEPATARGGELALVRSGSYSGYATAEDTRDYYKFMAARGRRGGPNLAFDLPTQCGHDSDEPIARGEVGKVGVAVDTLQDFEIIYEAFSGDNDLDKIASNYTINAPANIVIAMYVALARKRGIPSPMNISNT